MPCQGYTGLADATNPLIFSSRSQHPGGVQVALSDGSTRFMPETIDIITWRGLGTMNGGEVITLP